MDYIEPDTTPTLDAAGNPFFIRIKPPERTMQVKLRVKPPTFVYYTDAHNQPSLSQERFEWLAKYVNDVRPNYLIDGGDFDDFEALCSHVGNDTHNGRFKPTLEADLACAREARAILDAGIKCNPQKYVTLGNHEHRIWSFEDTNPELFGMLQTEYLAILHNFGWNVTPYKGYLTLHGIDFTHIPMNAMGRPIGGLNPTNQVATQSTTDVCFGHTHTLGMTVVPKLNMRSVKAFNGGCFMPLGYRPKYDEGTRKEYWYGVHTLQSIDGRLHIRESITMQELRERYSGKVH